MSDYYHFGERRKRDGLAALGSKKRLGCTNIYGQYQGPCGLSAIQVRLSSPFSGDTAPVPFQEEQLQEEAYAWEACEDFQGSLGSGDAVRVQETLFDAFAPQLPPAKRAVSKLLPAISALRIGCSNSRDIAWKDAFATISVGNEPINLRANAALALLHHLQWVYDVFSDVPDASVMIR